MTFGVFDPHQSPTLAQFGLVTLAGLLFASVGYAFELRRSKNKLPPGPKGTPFFGIRLSDKGLNDFEEWAKTYGDVMYLNVFGQGGIVLLNSHKAVVDLFDRREFRYRPELIVVNEFLTRQLLLTGTNDDDLWRKMRRVGHEVMNKTVVGKYYEMQQREALIFTENLLRDSTNWYQEVHRIALSGVLSALYDIPPTLSCDDPLIRKCDDFVKLIIRAGYPGNHLVGYFTWLKYLPAAISPWKSRANKLFEEYSALWMKLYREVEKKLNEGDATPGMVGHTIRQQERLGLSDIEASWLPVAYSNGGFSAAETILWFFVAMIVFPEKQRKCQEELDAVVGRSRMPTIVDRDNLPYMRAAIRELLRWRTISPVGVPRIAKQDEWYQGHFIPKGTSCYGHIWFINNNPNIYGPDVKDFNPDRFIGEDGQLLPALADTKDGHHSYGFGPRLCPARHYSNDLMFIAFAQLLWAASISPALDEKTGEPVIPDPMDVIGVTIRPRPFACVIKPRFPDAAEMVTHAKELLG